MNTGKKNNNCIKKQSWAGLDILGNTATLRGDVTENHWLQPQLTTKITLECTYKTVVVWVHIPDASQNLLPFAISIFPPSEKSHFKKTTYRCLSSLCAKIKSSWKEGERCRQQTAVSTCCWGWKILNELKEYLFMPTSCVAAPVHYIFFPWLSKSSCMCCSYSFQQLLLLLIGCN